MPCGPDPINLSSNCEIVKVENNSIETSPHGSSYCLTSWRGSIGKFPIFYLFIILVQKLFFDKKELEQTNYYYYIQGKMCLNERLNIYDLDKGALNCSILNGTNVIPMIIYSFDKKRK